MLHNKLSITVYIPIITTIKDEFDASDGSETDSYSDSDYEPEDLEITTCRKRKRRSRNLKIDQFILEYQSESDVEEVDEPKTCQFCLQFFNIGRGNNQAYLGFGSNMLYKSMFYTCISMCFNLKNPT